MGRHRKECPHARVIVLSGLGYSATVVMSGALNSEPSTWISDLPNAKTSRSRHGTKRRGAGSEEITMFSVQQKREISEKIQTLLRETGHTELPDSEIQFSLHVEGAEPWSWADIRNNGVVTNPSINPHNEQAVK